MENSPLGLATLLGDGNTLTEHFNRGKQKRLLWYPVSWYPV